MHTKHRKGFTSPSIMNESNFTNPKYPITDKTIRAMIEAYEEDKSGRRYTRQSIEREIEIASEGKNLDQIVAISNQFYASSTLYARMVEYFANMLPYYWYVVPRTKLKGEAATDDLFEVLDYIELINPEELGPEIARKVVLDGVCYAAVKEKITTKSSTFGLQYLPNKYCKSTKKYNGRSVVSFDLSFFDTKFTNKDKREEALESFPSFISDAYRAYVRKKNKTAESRWIDLDPNYAFKFALREDMIPYFIGVILDIFTLQDVKDISLFKMEQELSKLIIQKFKTDEEGQSVLLREELEAYHASTARMVDGVPGVDVITTFADIKVEDLTASQETATNNPVARKITDIFTSAGVSQSLFNADNAGSLQKSVTIDESVMFRMLGQISTFLQVRIDCNFKTGDRKSHVYKVSMPQVSQMGKDAVAKAYKEHGLGFSKILPFIVSGVRQSVALASAMFEQDIELDELINPQPAVASGSTTAQKPKAQDSGEKRSVGRPPKSDEERSEKTEANRESLGG